VKAAIYSRFSTDRQNESSIADQVRVCTEHADHQGWQIVECFEDQGISGAALGNRPGVLRLQEAALARRLDLVLVTDLSRLSRSNGDLSKMIDRLVVKGVRVVGVQDGYDSARRGHKLQAGLSGIIGEAFREMVKDRTYAALESRAKEGRATGGRAYGYHDGQVDKGEAVIVVEIFGRFADGASCRAIAAELNRRRISSPGSSWNRTERRASGWMGSGVRAILKNERYVGRVVWNKSEWRKDPDTGRRVRVERPKSDWIVSPDEGQRIVSDRLWNRAQRRFAQSSANGNWSTARGAPRYLLSGLLRCSECGAHFTICNQREYGCPSHRNGACTNGARVRRERIEGVILDPLRQELLAPDRVRRMADEMQAAYIEHVKAQQSRATEVPKELRELDARLTKLREMQRMSPDMADELQAAVDRAEGKRRDLGARQPQSRQAAKLLSIVPRAAELYRRQINAGLDGDPRAALKARVALRELFVGGKIDLQPEPDGSLWAVGQLQPGVLMRQAVAVGNGGSGGVLLIYLPLQPGGKSPGNYFS
jgi:DNA invertase Pin-like site-specific DNA recombinase